MLGFRDYLRSHPIEAHEYAELKRKAAQEVNEDGAKYRELKGPISKKILEDIIKDASYPSGEGTDSTG